MDSALWHAMHEGNFVPHIKFKTTGSEVKHFCEANQIWF